jgi:hypothetical protein
VHSWLFSAAKSVACNLQLPNTSVLAHVHEISGCDLVKGIFSALLSSFSSRDQDLFSVKEDEDMLKSNHMPKLVISGKVIKERKLIDFLN